jgi:hypothetical protein
LWADSAHLRTDFWNVSTYVEEHTIHFFSFLTSFTNHNVLHFHPFHSKLQDYTFLAEYHSTVYVHPSSVVGYYGWFHVCSVVNSAAIIMGTQVSLSVLTSCFLGHYLSFSLSFSL